MDEVKLIDKTVIGDEYRTMGWTGLADDLKTITIDGVSIRCQAGDLVLESLEGPNSHKCTIGGRPVAATKVTVTLAVGEPAEVTITYHSDLGLFVGK